MSKPIVIGVCGRAGSGKTTVQKYMSTHLGSYNITLAAPIKRMVQQIYRFSHNQIYGTQEDKETIDERFGISPRQAMQEYGKLIRDELGEDIWINKALKDILYLNFVHFNAGDTQDVYVIDDVRYINEANIIKNDKRIKGYLIKLECPDAPKSKYSDHASEQEVDLIDPRLFEKIIIRNRSPEAHLLKGDIADLLMEWNSTLDIKFIDQK